MIRTIVELDLKGYSDVARELEEHFSANLVMKFNDQIQMFVTDALKVAGVARKDALMATTGDGAILMFDTPSVAHVFAEAVHNATRFHNHEKTLPTAKRWFRIGIATGELEIDNSDGIKKMAGTVIARAVRLESVGNIGEILADEKTYAGLSREQRSCYGASEQIAGKRDETFSARRYAVVKMANQPRRWIVSGIVAFLVTAGVAWLIWKHIVKEASSGTATATNRQIVPQPPKLPPSNVTNSAADKVETVLRAISEHPLSINQSGTGNTLNLTLNIYTTAVDTNAPKGLESFNFLQEDVSILTKIGGIKDDRTLALIVFNSTIVNLKHQATLKEPTLLYAYDGQEDEVTSTILGDGTDRGRVGLKGINRPSLIIGPWVDLRAMIRKNEVKEPGGVWKGSAAFIFPATVKDYSKLSNVRLRVSDYRGNSEVFLVKIFPVPPDGVQFELWLGNIKDGTTYGEMLFLFRPSEARAIEEANFPVNIDFVEVAKRPEDTILWFVRNNQRHPIHIAAVITLPARPIMLAAFEIEGEVQKGVWQPLPAIDVRDGRVFRGPATNVSPVVSFPEGVFAANVTNHLLELRKPFAGWAFFQIPRGGPGTNWRINLIGIDGRMQSEPLKRVSPLEHPIHLAPVAMNRNISAIPLATYSK